MSGVDILIAMLLPFVDARVAVFYAFLVRMLLYFIFGSALAIHLAALA